MMTDIKTKKFFNMLAFYSIIFLAVSLLLRQIFGNGGNVFAQITQVITQIAQALAYVAASIAAYGYVRAKRSVVYIILYVIAVVLIAVFVIWPIFVA